MNNIQKKINLFKSSEKTIKNNTKNEIDKIKYIKRGTKKFNEVLLALFSGGLATFAILYCVQPMLPVFSINFNLTPAQSSLSLSSATAMMAIGMLITGPLSDFIGRKILMSFSLISASIFTILCSQMTSWNEIILMRSLTGLSLSGVAAVAMTYLSEEIHPSILSFSIGLYISGNAIGGFSGRLIAGILSTKFSWNIALLIIGSISFISSLFFLWLLPNSKNFKSITLNSHTLISNFFIHLNDKYLSKLFMMGFILMGSFVTLFNYIGYRLTSYPFSLNQSMIGLLSVVYLTGTYSSPKAGILTNKYHRSNVLIGSLLLMISGLIITEFNNLIIIIPGLMLFSAGFFAAHSVSSSWIGHRVKIAKGQASSLYLFFYYLGSSIFGTFGGIFWFAWRWLGISIFIIFMLSLGILLAHKLKLSSND
ncbi:MFS transporter [Buchnera aphidicola (Neophyllaphis podocarpi)]|uniref:MFS transporter n=1 Tax=Buchnera aphidicola TaxID=9 RepID=UPI0031B84E69